MRYNMDMQSYEEGYKAALEATIKHLESRIQEEKGYADEWHDRTEYLGYIRALQDCKKYLEWVLNLEPNRKSN